MAWEIEVTGEFAAWYAGLDDEDLRRVNVAVEALEEGGPGLGRPFVDTIQGSRHTNMKELRPRGGHLRILFAFDPRRTALLLIGGDKTREWSAWYAPMRSTMSTSRHCGVERTALGVGMARKFADINRPGRSDARAQAQSAAERRAMEDVRTLAALLEARGQTRAEMDQSPAVDQANIARIEHREDHYLSTLSEYVAALGGRLELVAVFPDRRISLTVPAPAEVDSAAPLTQGAG